MLPHCPHCQSKNITKSKRRGLLESMVLKLVHVRPYRCLACDSRFFRWAAQHGPDTSRVAATSIRQDFQRAISPLAPRKRS
jgi:DNA-directed RNA polymerase subunit RPC12/RpoP